ncbi:Retrotransposon gag protein [Corchorus capsularis]|uniref:Retrotransposon gag protein n=1 Tax=Corchorus capsularis TaxID=210143 RepID=A0A1R3GTH3_COCAP|nr:Retrotransposon gag protein [Corchorus capsularis]
MKSPCIDYLEDFSFELKPGVVRLLPIFHGGPHENRHEHLQDFIIKCAMITGMPQEQAKLRTFPITLEGKAKEWFWSLPSKSITSWKEMERVFLNQYFPEAKRADVRRRINSCRQLPKEKWFQYWKRYNKICESCPYHNISEELLIQQFYDGLFYEDRVYIDATSGGSLTFKTPTEVRKLLNIMAENIHQFSTSEEILKPKEPEAESSMHKEMKKMKEVVQSLVTEKDKVYQLLSKQIADQQDTIANFMRYMVANQGVKHHQQSILQASLNEAQGQENNMEHDNELNNAQRYGINSMGMEDDQPRITKEMESQETPFPFSTPQVKAVLPTPEMKPSPTVIPHVQMLSNEESSVKRKEKEKFDFGINSVSSPTISQDPPRKKREPKKIMPPNDCPAPFPQLLEPQKTCCEESQLNSLHKWKVNIPLVATIKQVPKEEWKMVDGLTTQKDHEEEIEDTFSWEEPTNSEPSTMEGEFHEIVVPIMKEIEEVLSKAMDDLESQELKEQNPIQFSSNDEDDTLCMVCIPTTPKETPKIVQEVKEIPKEDIEMDIPPPSLPKIAKHEEPPYDEHFGHPKDLKDLVDDQVLELTYPNLEVNKFLKQESYGEEEWISMDQFLLKDEEINQVEDTPQRQVRSYANHGCHKLSLHQPLTATQMALSFIAIHGVALNKIGECFPYLLFCASHFCVHIPLTSSYLLFALKWYDPP